MATNDTRSQNSELRLGMVERSMPHTTPDRGGEVDSAQTSRLNTLNVGAEHSQANHALTETPDAHLYLPAQTY